MLDNVVNIVFFTKDAIKPPIMELLDILLLLAYTSTIQIGISMHLFSLSISTVGLVNSLATNFSFSCELVACGP